MSIILTHTEYVWEKILFSKSSSNENFYFFVRTKVSSFFPTVWVKIFNYCYFCTSLWMALMFLQGTVCTKDIEPKTVGLLKVKETPADIRTSIYFKLVNKSDVIFHVIIYLACRDRKLTELWILLKSYCIKCLPKLRKSNYMLAQQALNKNTRYNSLCFLPLCKDNHQNISVLKMVRKNTHTQQIPHTLTFSFSFSIYL